MSLLYKIEVAFLPSLTPQTLRGYDLGWILSRSACSNWGTDDSEVVRGPHSTLGKRDPGGAGSAPPPVPCTCFLALKSQHLGAPGSLGGPVFCGLIWDVGTRTCLELFILHTLELARASRHLRIGD